MLEYSSVIYGPLITKYQSNELERFQKRCLKVMFGYDKSYSELLHLSELETLEKRREKALEKFEKTAMENENYKDLFPLKQCTRTL